MLIRSVALAADLRVTQTVNGSKGIHCMIAKSLVNSAAEDGQEVHVVMGRPCSTEFAGRDGDAPKSAVCRQIADGGGGMTTDTKEIKQRLIRLAESPKARFWRLEYGALSVPERIFRAVWELEAQVNNGGFHQYFWNSSGSLVPDVVNALRAIGAAQMASVVERAIDALRPRHFVA